MKRRKTNYRKILNLFLKKFYMYENQVREAILLYLFASKNGSNYQK